MLLASVHLSYVRIDAKVHSRVISGEDDALVPLLDHAQLWFCQVPRLLDIDLLTRSDELADWRFDVEQGEEGAPEEGAPASAHRDFGQMTRLIRRSSPQYDDKHLQALRGSPDMCLPLFSA